MSNLSGLYINQEALEKASDSMRDLYDRTDALYKKLDDLFAGVNSALITPAGSAIKQCGREAALDPIEDMKKIILHMSTTLDTIRVGGDGSANYSQIFDEYQRLASLLKNKTTK